MRSQALFYFFKIVLARLAPLRFSINFRIGLSVLQKKKKKKKKPAGIRTGIALAVDAAEANSRLTSTALMWSISPLLLYIGDARTFSLRAS